MSRAPRQGACFHGGIALDADRGFAAWVTRMAVSTLVQGTGRSMVVCSMGVGIGAARQGRCLWTIRQRAKCRCGVAAFGQEEDQAHVPLYLRLRSSTRRSNRGGLA